MIRAAAGVAIAVIALVTFFQFPGHTWLQQDTQIYVPILEHLRDSSVLQRDLLVQYPHVSFTLYDELAIGLRNATGLGFEGLLGGLQILCRGLGIWGVYLIAVSAGLDVWVSLMAAMIFSLGATIAGPSVLTLEYEPTPRAFAVPLVFCAIGLMSQKRYTWAGIAAGAGVLIHAPTTIPFWLALAWISLRRGRLTWPVWVGLGCSAIMLVVAARLQVGPHLQPEFFGRLAPEQEAVQRMRAAYNWVSMWPASIIAQHAALYVFCMLAYSRVKHRLPPDARAFSLILPLIGILSLPVSYFLLDRMKWSLMAQIQPARALLFVAAFAMILGCVAAVAVGRALESVCWFALVFFVPMRAQLFEIPPVTQVMVVVTLAIGATAALRGAHRLLPAVAALAFFIIPMGGVVNYPNLHTRDIAELARWGRSNTRRDAQFLFPDEGRLLYSGIYRVEAQRAVYVDWKAGGQVNYLKEFAVEWRSRWDLMNRIGFADDAVALYRGLGVDYLVLRKEHRLPGLQPIYQNAQYAVYRIAG